MTIRNSFGNRLGVVLALGSALAGCAHNNYSSQQREYERGSLSQTIERCMPYNGYRAYAFDDRKVALIDTTSSDFEKTAAVIRVPIRIGDMPIMSIIFDRSGEQRHLSRYADEDSLDKVFLQVMAHGRDIDPNTNDPYYRELKRLNSTIKESVREIGDPIKKI